MPAERTISTALYTIPVRGIQKNGKTLDGSEEKSNCRESRAT